jgi:hypothetical protein
LTRCALCCIFE